MCQNTTCSLNQNHTWKWLVPLIVGLFLLGVIAFFIYRKKRR